MVAGDRRAPAPLIARLLELLARTLGVQGQGSSSKAAKPEVRGATYLAALDGRDGHYSEGTWLNNRGWCCCCVRRECR